VAAGTSAFPGADVPPPFSDQHYLESSQMSDETKVYETEKPLISVYGKNPPRAAQFGKGAQTIEEVRDALEKRRDLKPGVYGNR
jgi:hypothetical protein